uniref:WEB family protein At1g75720-like n=1 Tax=Erigeron canadensis TaxID=72917 RepID=UPI001CB972F8|nr:WEB family protein At1g75720-like [Erigeron canadensis]
MDQPTSLHENPPPTLPPLDDHSTVDTSSPFRSVKEVVAMFGERFLATKIYTPSPKPSFTLPIQESTPIWKYTPNSNKNLWKSPKNELDSSPVVMNILKKLELELEETKRQLNMLKERETETELSLASLNAELHKNMSKIAKAEAEVAGKAATMRSSMTLAQVLSGSNADDDDDDQAIEKGKEKRYLNEKKMLKKKPVIPLLTDLFSKKNEKAENSKLSPLYASSLMY